jgi:peptidoglycan-associated lipoprotein
MRKIVLPFLLVVACSSQKEAPPPQAAPPPAPASQPVANAAPAGKSCSADTECGDKQLCIRNQCVDITAGLAECSTIRVHFDLDATELHADDRTNLDRMSRCLRADLALHVTIEGNADERGTEEYNLSLGQKRAQAVDKYLQAMGVSETQLKTISYGKEKPVCREHDEACWSQNRRAAIKPKEQVKEKKKK